MSLHHATLGAAVKKYGPLKPTIPEAALRVEIGNDDKAFDPDGIKEILAALPDVPDNEPDQNPDIEQDNEGGAPEPEKEPVAPAPAKQKKAKGHRVLIQFRDKDNFAKLYEIGEDVSHFDDARKADLVNRKLIEAI